MRLRRAPRPDRPASSWREHVGVENRQGEPRRLSRAIFPMNAARRCAWGKAPMQGASEAVEAAVSLGESAACAANGGCRSGKRSAISSLCASLSPQAHEVRVQCRACGREELPGLPTSAILSRSRSAVSTSSCRARACAKICPRGSQNNFARKIRRCSTAASVPTRLMAPDEVSVRGCMCWLLQLPEVFAQTGDGAGWIEDDLRSVEAERSCAFRKMRS